MKIYSYSKTYKSFFFSIFVFLKMKTKTRNYNEIKNVSKNVIYYRFRNQISFAISFFIDCIDSFSARDSNSLMWIEISHRRNAFGARNRICFLFYTLTNSCAFLQRQRVRWLFPTWSEVYRTSFGSGLSLGKSGPLHSQRVPYHYLRSVFNFTVIQSLNETSTWTKRVVGLGTCFTHWWLIAPRGLVHQGQNARSYYYPALPAKILSPANAWPVTRRNSKSKIWFIVLFTMERLFTVTIFLLVVTKR